MATPSESSPLTQGGHLRSIDFHSRCYITTTPPQISASTHVVAATHPSIVGAAPELDGWFVADFYAFNHLLYGLGASQTWLALSDPQAIVDKYGQYAHGNPFEKRRVVLSQELLQEGNRLTPVTVVRPGSIVDKFLGATRIATEKAKKEKGSVLLLLFCHGVDQEHLALDYTGKTTLSTTMLRGVLEPYVPVCLLTTACYSGGWTVCPELNISTMTAADAMDMSSSWPQSTSPRQSFSGSVFVSSIIESLTSTTSKLDSQDKKDDQQAKTGELRHMQPDQASPDQIATYNAFCMSVWASCRGMYRLWNNHTFTFSAQGDDWEESRNISVAVPLFDYSTRWDKLPIVQYQGSNKVKLALNPSPHNPGFQEDAAGQPPRSGAVEIDMFIGPLIQSIYKTRISEMVKLWQHHACPGETVQGYGHKLNALMNHCIKTGSPTQTGVDVDHDDPASLWNIVAIIQYRLNMAFLAESILDAVHLPRPRGQSCLLWDRYRWQDEMANTLNIGHPELHRQVGLIWNYFLRAGLISATKPTAEQGPVFNRFLQYIAAAVVQAQKPDEDRLSDMTIIVQRLMSTAKFYEEAALNSPNVKRRKLEWLQSLGQ